MAAPNSHSSTKHWDSFARHVQFTLVERWRVQNLKIVVPRHDGRNGNVRLKNLSFFPNENGSSISSLGPGIDHDRRMSPEQPSLDQFAFEIQRVLDKLLQKCNVKYGRIKLVVKQGLLRETKFSDSKRPDEPTDKHFS